VRKQGGGDTPKRKSADKGKKITSGGKEGARKSKGKNHRKGLPKIWGGVSRERSWEEPSTVKMPNDGVPFHWQRGEKKRLLKKWRRNGQEKKKTPSASRRGG